MLVKTFPSGRQDAFNRVWKWFVVEKHPQCTDGTKKNPLCLYRSKNGKNACAAGICIPDKILPKFHKEIEKMSSIDFVIDHYDKIAYGFNINNLDKMFMERLQQAHDARPIEGEAFAERIRQELIDLAHAFNLNIPGTNGTKQRRH